MNNFDIAALLRENAYPGRGILLGRSQDGAKAVMAYFIMGRSENSRNRIFEVTDDGIRTRAFDESKMTDPSLIIYHPIRKVGRGYIVTNGDQTDTIREYLEKGLPMEQALRTRCFEPDGPNWTPRISGLLSPDGSYKLSILKSADAEGTGCLRQTFEYPGQAGVAHFLHTYRCDGDPIPSFAGEPEQVASTAATAKELAELLWQNLNADNKVSLFVRYVDLATGQTDDVLYNKHSKYGGTLMKELELKYGCNPNQKPSRIYMKSGELPIEVLNGKPGYINFMDAFNSWQLVKGLKAATGLPAAASFKHVSPAGAAVGTPLTELERQIYFVEPDAELSPVACAYIRARGADRLCSYGDWAALSDVCDAATAQYLKNEVSDGIIAPGYTDEALAILKTKKKGNYNVVRIDPDYVPAPDEHRDIFGITFEQGYNDLAITREMFQNIVTDAKELPEEAIRDLLIAQITLKYTQSNSVCYVKNGQTIGVGAGQQSRIHCTRLAGNKANNWWLRQHPKVLGLQFVDGIRRPDRDNAIDIYTSDEYEDILADGVWQNTFKTKPEVLSPEEKKEWISKLSGVSVGSDAFFPFGDNVERARKSGVQYIVQPGGSIRDDHVIATYNKYGIVMAFTGIRLFHH